MLEKILIFVLFLGPLVFFHELGHFLFARLFGVRVEVFSIGFGPKIFKFKRGFTEYAISLIPLGGYVKMFGDDPLNSSELPENLRRYSYVFKSKFARFWIVFGGPLANFILAFFIFFTLYSVGEKVPEIKIGNIHKHTEFYNYGFRSGDVLKSINNNIITSPSDIALESSGRIQTVTVIRNSSEHKINIDIASEKFFEKMMDYPPLFIKPIFISKNGEYFAFSKSKDSVNWDLSLDELTLDTTLVYMHKIIGEVEESKNPNIDLTSESQQVDLSEISMEEYLTTNELYPIDLVVKSVNMNSPADKAGIKSGDIIFNIGQERVHSFEGLRRVVQGASDEGIEIKILRNSNVMNLKITPDVQVISGATVKLIGVYSSVMYIPGKFINTEPLSFIDAGVKSFSRTGDSISKVLEGFKKLIFAESSLKNIGGPLTIGKVASDSFNTSLSYFFQLMALISVNLGVINLFPIPVLDGGHLMFIALEAINGGPLSRRKLEIAQQFGLSLLLLLMVGALFNDFIRFL